MATAPRTKPAAQRRSDLLAAAKQVFLDKGVAGTTIEDITTTAGVAKGSFYLHFESKEDVRAALQHEVISEHVTATQEAMARHDPGDWWGRLDTWMASTIHGYAAPITGSTRCCSRTCLSRQRSAPASAPSTTSRPTR